MHSKFSPLRLLPVWAALPELPHCVGGADESAAAPAALAAFAAAIAVAATVAATATIAAAPAAVLGWGEQQLVLD